MASGQRCAKLDMSKRGHRLLQITPARRITTKLTLAALRAAVAARRPSLGCIDHSDRGSQYTAEPYRRGLAEYGLSGSMSRRGNPYDNGKAESFMKTRKCEEVYSPTTSTLDRSSPSFLTSSIRSTPLDACSRRSVISRRCTSNRNGARPPRALLGRRTNRRPAHRRVRLPWIRNR
jgi:transposase InsO family protein